MFVFDESCLEKTISRKRALGYKSLVINEDVENGCEVDMSLGDDGKIIIARADDFVPTEDNVEPEINLLIKEFGVFGGIDSRIEVTFCDGAFLITLIEGAIDINIDGKVMMASRGVDVESISCQGLDSIVWISVEKLLSFTQYWCGANKEYPYDYIYLLNISGDATSSRCISAKPVDVNAFLVDISNGKFDELEVKRELERRTKEAKAILNSTYERGTSGDIDDSDYNPDDYMDEDEDEDDDDDYMYG